MSLIGAVGLPHDPHGCRRPEGHEGPHECVDSMGRIYQWETDWECDCEHCSACEGDYCFTYWEVAPNQALQPTETF